MMNIEPYLKAWNTSPPLTTRLQQADEVKPSTDDKTSREASTSLIQVINSPIG